MKDMRAHLEKLLTDAEECALISKLATDMEKRELFAKLAAHLKVLAAEVERAIAAKKASEHG
jgi:heme oxygenase